MDSKLISDKVRAKVASAYTAGEDYQKQENESQYPSRSAGMAFTCGMLKANMLELAEALASGALVVGDASRLPWWLRKDA